jgi:hypothetical protein
VNSVADDDPIAYHILSASLPILDNGRGTSEFDSENDDLKEYLSTRPFALELNAIDIHRPVFSQASDMSSGLLLPTKTTILSVRLFPVVLHHPRRTRPIMLRTTLANRPAVKYVGPTLFALTANKSLPRRAQNALYNGSMKTKSLSCMSRSQRDSRTHPYFGKPYRNMTTTCLIRMLTLISTRRLSRSTTFESSLLIYTLTWISANRMSHPTHWLSGSMPFRLVL